METGAVVTVRYGCCAGLIGVVVRRYRKTCVIRVDCVVGATFHEILSDWLEAK